MKFIVYLLFLMGLRTMTKNRCKNSFEINVSEEIVFLFERCQLCLVYFWMFLLSRSASCRLMVLFSKRERAFVSDSIVSSYRFFVFVSFSSSGLSKIVIAQFAIRILIPSRWGFQGIHDSFHSVRSIKSILLLPFFRCSALCLGNGERFLKLNTALQVLNSDFTTLLAPLRVSLK